MNVLMPIDKIGRMAAYLLEMIDLTDHFRRDFLSVDFAAECACCHLADSGKLPPAGQLRHHTQRCAEREIDVQSDGDKRAQLLCASAELRPMPRRDHDAGRRE